MVQDSISGASQVFFDKVVRYNIDERVLSSYSIQFHHRLNMDPQRCPNFYPQNLWICYFSCERTFCWPNEGYAWVWHYPGLSTWARLITCDLQPEIYDAWFLKRLDRIKRGEIESMRMTLPTTTGSHRCRKGHKRRNVGSLGKLRTTFSWQPSRT